jgi:hypothetical protein
VIAGRIGRDREVSLGILGSPATEASDRPDEPSHPEEADQPV